MFLNYSRIDINIYLEFKWRSALSASVRTTLSGSYKKPFVKSYSIYYEIIYTQMAYAFILSNIAFKNFVNDSSDDTLNVAIKDLCKGILLNFYLIFKLISNSIWNISFAFNFVCKYVEYSRRTSGNNC